MGKYTGLQDSYLSVLKGLKHSSIHLKVKINIQWIEASDLEPVTSTTTNGDDDSVSQEEVTKKYEENMKKHEAAWNILKSAGTVNLSNFLIGWKMAFLSQGVLAFVE